MMKILAATLAGLVVAAPAAAQAPAPPFGELVVRGSATVTQKPDLAHLALSVVTTGPTLDATGRDHAARVARAATTLAQWTAQGASVDQGSFSLGEDSEPDARNSGKPVVIYRAETRYDLTVSAIEKLDAIEAGLVSSGLFEVGPTSYAVADEAASIDRVRRAAMADARHQAEIYADAGGVRLDSIERIAEGEASGREPVPVMAMRMAKAATMGAAPPKTLTFQGSVTVTWRIAPR